MPPINPNSPLIQLAIIGMICLLPTGSYFGMDSPAPFEKNLKESITTRRNPEKDLNQTTCPNGFNETIEACNSHMSHDEYRGVLDRCTVFDLKSGKIISKIYFAVRERCQLDFLTRKSSKRSILRLNRGAKLII